MAFATSGLLDRVSCVVCFEQYDNKKRVPKILPCQHTYCLSCLMSIGAETIDIKCPGCRKKHKVPQKGFTTNRAILDVVDELLKDATSGVLMCTKHTSRESVLVCVECFEGLCSKCLKTATHTSDDHHSHQLEELDDAKIQLRQKFERQTKEKQLSLQEKIALIKQSAYSVEQIAKAESDISKMCEKIETITMKWKEAQLTQMAKFKEEAAKQDDTIQAEVENLQSLLQQEDIGIGTLISELKQGNSQWNPDLENSFERNQYKFGACREELVATLFTEISSKESITSDFLKTGQTAHLETIHGLFTDNKDSINNITVNSDGSKLTPERDVLLGNINGVWNYGKKFIIVTLVFMVISLCSLLFLHDTQNIPFARLVGLDVDSIIAEKLRVKLHPKVVEASYTYSYTLDEDLDKTDLEMTFSIVGIGAQLIINDLALMAEEGNRKANYVFATNKSRKQMEHEIIRDSAAAVSLCIILFQIIAHLTALLKTSDNGVICLIKYGCSYTFVYFVSMSSVISWHYVFFGQFLEITIAVVGFSFATSFSLYIMLHSNYTTNVTYAVK